MVTRGIRSSSAVRRRVLRTGSPRGRIPAHSDERGDGGCATQSPSFIGAFMNARLALGFCVVFVLGAVAGHWAGRDSSKTPARASIPLLRALPTVEWRDCER